MVPNDHRILYETSKVAEWKLSDLGREFYQLLNSHKLVEKDGSRANETSSSSFLTSLTSGVSSANQKLLETLTNTLNNTFISTSIHPYLLIAFQELGRYTGDSFEWKIAYCQSTGDLAIVRSNNAVEVVHSNQQGNGASNNPLNFNFKDTLSDRFPSWRNVIFSPDGRFLITSYSNGIIDLVYSSNASSNASSSSKSDNCCIRLLPHALKGNKFLRQINAACMRNPPCRLICQAAETIPFKAFGKSWKYRLLVLGFDAVLRVYVFNEPEATGTEAFDPSPSNLILFNREEQYYPSNNNSFPLFSFCFKKSLRKKLLIACDMTPLVGDPNVILVVGKPNGKRTFESVVGRHFLSSWKIQMETGNIVQATVFDEPGGDVLNSNPSSNDPGNSTPPASPRSKSLEDINISTPESESPSNVTHVWNRLQSFVKYYLTFPWSPSAVNNFTRDIVRRCALSSSGKFLALLDFEGEMTIWQRKESMQKFNLFKAWDRSSLTDHFKKLLAAESASSSSDTVDLNIKLVSFEFYRDDTLLLILQGYKEKEVILVLSPDDDFKSLLVDSKIQELSFNTGVKVTCALDCNSFFILDRVERRVRIPYFSTDKTPDYNRIRIINSKTTTPTDHSGSAPQGSQSVGGNYYSYCKNIALSPLKYLNDTFLWNFDGDSQFGIYKVPIYQLLVFNEMTPMDLMLAKLEMEEYGEALRLASLYDLETDIIYQYQWNQSEISEFAIEHCLSNIKDKVWVAHSCLLRISELSSLEEKLLLFGLESATRSVESTIASLPIPDKMYLDEDETLLAKFRIRLADYLERLYLFKELQSVYEEEVSSGNAHFFFNNESDFESCFANFREIPLIDLAFVFASLQQFDLLRVLFTWYGKSQLLPFRLAILESIPESCDPSLYADFLPVVSEEADIESLEIVHTEKFTSSSAKKCEQFVSSKLRELFPIPSESGKRQTLLLLEYPAKKGPLFKWLKSRVLEIERVCGQIGVARTLVSLCQERGFAQLFRSLSEKIAMYELILYERSTSLYQFQTLTLEAFEAMEKKAVISLFLGGSGIMTAAAFEAAESVGSSSAASSPISTVPSISVNLENVEADAKFLISHYLTDGDLSPFFEYLIESCKGGSVDTSNSRVVASSSSSSSSLGGDGFEVASHIISLSNPLRPEHERIIRDECDLIRVSLGCSYQMTRLDQLPLVNKIFESLPQRNEEEEEEGEEYTSSTAKNEGKREASEISKLHDQIDRLELHLNMLEILSSYNIFYPLAEIRENLDIDHDGDDTISIEPNETRINFVREKLVGRLCKSLGPADSDISWRRLYLDLNSVFKAATCTTNARIKSKISDDFVVESFAISALNCKKYRIGKEVLYPSAASKGEEGGVVIGGIMTPNVSHEKAESIILSVAVSAFNAADNWNLKKANNKHAYECLTLAPPSRLINAELDLLEACEEIYQLFGSEITSSFYGPSFGIFPVHLREQYKTFMERLDLLDQLIERGTDAFLYPERLISICRKLLSSVPSNTSNDMYLHIGEMRTRCKIAAVCLAHNQLANLNLAYEMCESVIKQVYSISKYENEEDLMKSLEELALSVCLDLVFSSLNNNNNIDDEDEETSSLLIFSHDSILARRLALIVSLIKVVKEDALPDLLDLHSSLCLGKSFETCVKKVIPSSPTGDKNKKSSPKSSGGNKSQSKDDDKRSVLKILEDQVKEIGGGGGDSHHVRAKRYLALESGHGLIDYQFHSHHHHQHQNSSSLSSTESNKGHFNNWDFKGCMTKSSSLKGPLDIWLKVYSSFSLRGGSVDKSLIISKVMRIALELDLGLFFSLYCVLGSLEENLDDLLVDRVIHPDFRDSFQVYLKLLSKHEVMLKNSQYSCHVFLMNPSEWFSRLIRITNEDEKHLLGSLELHLKKSLESSELFFLRVISQARVKQLDSSSLLEVDIDRFLKDETYRRDCLLCIACQTIGKRSFNRIVKVIKRFGLDPSEFYLARIAFCFDDSNGTSIASLQKIVKYHEQDADRVIDLGGDESAFISFCLEKCCSGRRINERTRILYRMMLQSVMDFTSPVAMLLENVLQVLDAILDNGGESMFEQMALNDLISANYGFERLEDDPFVRLIVRPLVNEENAAFFIQLAKACIHLSRINAKTLALDLEGITPLPLDEVLVNRIGEISLCGAKSHIVNCKATTNKGINLQVFNTFLQGAGPQLASFAEFILLRAQLSFGEQRRLYTRIVEEANEASIPSNLTHIFNYRMTIFDFFNDASSVSDGDRNDWMERFHRLQQLSSKRNESGGGGDDDEITGRLVVQYFSRNYREIGQFSRMSSILMKFLGSSSYYLRERLENGSIVQEILVSILLNQQSGYDHFFRLLGESNANSTMIRDQLEKLTEESVTAIPLDVKVEILKYLRRQSSSSSSFSLPSTGQTTTTDSMNIIQLQLEVKNVFEANVTRDELKSNFYSVLASLWDGVTRDKKKVNFKRWYWILEHLVPLSANSNSNDDDELELKLLLDPIRSMQGDEDDANERWSFSLLVYMRLKDKFTSMPKEDNENVKLLSKLILMNDSCPSMTLVSNDQRVLKKFIFFYHRYHCLKCPKTLLCPSDYYALLQRVIISPNGDKSSNALYEDVAVLLVLVQVINGEINDNAVKSSCTRKLLADRIALKWLDVPSCLTHDISRPLTTSSSPGVTKVCRLALEQLALKLAEIGDEKSTDSHSSFSSFEEIFFRKLIRECLDSFERGNSLMTLVTSLT